MPRRRLPRNTPDILDGTLHLAGEISAEIGGAASHASTAGRARVGDGVEQGGHPLGLQRHERPWGRNAVLMGIAPDGGVADQTAAVLAALTELDGAPEPLRIPPGVRFDFQAVAEDAPVGAMMEWLDTVNSGQPPGYKNTYWRLWRKDVAADDWALEIASSNHPFIFLSNDGAAGSDSGDRRLCSIGQKVGMNGFNDPVMGFLDSWYYDPDSDQFIRSFRLQSEARVAMNFIPWAAGAEVALNSYVQSTNTGYIYKVTTAGALGVTAPTHDAGTVANGTAQLQYYAPRILVDATMLLLTEGGDLGVTGIGTNARVIATANGRRGWLAVDGSAEVISLRDGIRGQDMIRSAPGRGTQLMGFRSTNLQPVTGAVPVIGQSDVYLTQTGATDVTGFGGIDGLTSVDIEVFFGDGHSTLKHSGTLVLDGAVDFNPPAGTTVSFRRYSSHSSALFERYRTHRA